MEIDKLMKVAEDILEDLGIEKKYTEDAISEMETAKLLESTFESTLNLHDSFMEEAAGGNPLLASHETKKAIFNVMVKLHDIILVQDQMDLPN